MKKAILILAVVVIGCGDFETNKDGINCPTCKDYPICEGCEKCKECPDCEECEICEDCPICEECYDFNCPISPDKIILCEYSYYPSKITYGQLTKERMIVSNGINTTISKYCVKKIVKGDGYEFYNQTLCEYIEELPEWVDTEEEIEEYLGIDFEIIKENEDGQIIIAIVSIDLFQEIDEEDWPEGEVIMEITGWYIYNETKVSNKATATLIIE